MNEELIAMMIPVTATLGAVVIVIVMLLMRGRRAQMLHQERMAVIEKGIEIPAALLSDSTQMTATGCLLRGLIWILVGAGLGVFFVAMGVSEGDKELYATSTIALVPIGVGVAYLVCYRKLEREGAGQGEAAGAKL